MKKNLLSTIFFSAVSLISSADELKVTPLVTHTELGYIQTDGNTKTKTFNIDANAKKAWDKHEGSILFDGQYATNDTIETKNKFLTEINYDYSFSKRFSFNYLFGYKSDKFSGFDYQTYTGPGIKYKAIETKIHKLSFEGNILYALDQYSNIEYDANGVEIAYPNPNNTPIVTIVKGQKQDYASYRLKGVYNYKITKFLKFNQELTFRGSFKTSSVYFIYSKSSLSSKLSDIFSAGLGYTTDYTHKPALGKKHTDTTLTLNLIIDY